MPRAHSFTDPFSLCFGVTRTRDLGHALDQLRRAPNPQEVDDADCTQSRIELHFLRLIRDNSPAPGVYLGPCPDNDRPHP